MGNIEDRIENLELTFGIKTRDDEIELSPEEKKERIDRLYEICRITMKEKFGIEPEPKIEGCLDRDEKMCLKIEFIRESVEKTKQNR